MFQVESSFCELYFLSVMSQGYSGICKVFASGNYCKFGRQCRYLHFRKPKSRSKTNYNKDEAVKHSGPADLHSDSCFSAVSSFERRNDGLLNKHDFTGGQVEFGKDSHQRHKVCKYYLRGSCAKRDRCTFLHADVQQNVEHVTCDTEQDAAEGKEATFLARSLNSANICHHFRRGYCRYGDSCRWSHELPLIFEDSKSTDNEKVIQGTKSDFKSKQSTKNEIRPSVVVGPSLQLEFPVDEIGETNHILRDKEMVYFKKRFPKAESVGDGEFKFVFRPSDPDWPYDVRCLNMRVSFPVDYPMNPVRIILSDNDQLPETVQRYIWKTVEEWLNDRFTEFEKKGKVELVMRACVRWLDRSMEDLFTEGLKAYQRELIAKAAGIEFVPASQLREEFAKRRSDSDVSNSNNDEERDGEQSNDDEDDDYIGHDLLVANPNHSDGLEAAKKGTEVKLYSLQLKEKSSSLLADRVSVIVQCGRCKNKTEFDTPPGRINVFECAKCGQEQLVTFRANMAHQFTSIIGYLDMKDCIIHDMVLPECHFKVGCLECGRDMNFGGIIPGQIKESWCHSCHGKLAVCSESAKFLNLQPAELDIANALHLNVKKVKKVPKDPSIREGFPLPSDGICKHYKKSFRWFRFPCCGKAYPCDVCHDDNESHENVFANRMICGFCCKEQSFSAERPCIGCSRSLTKTSSSHWEGGRGCRDKIKMSRNDEAKYKNMSKTLSRKSQAKSTTAKSTKLRHS